MKKFLPIISAIIACFITMLPQAGYAQPGALDTTFNPASGVFTQGAASNQIATSVTQADGKIIIIGDFSNYNVNYTVSNIIRLNTNGTKDQSFNPDPSVNLNTRGLAIQPDGKIIVGTRIGYIFGVTRLNTDGSIDAAFNPGMVNNIKSIKVQQDGKIIIAGEFASYNGVERRGIARLNPDGSLDNGFNPGAIFFSAGQTGSVNNISLQPDGKIVLAGIGYYDYGIIPNSSNSHSGITRLNADGTIDNSFYTTFPPNVNNPDNGALVSSAFVNQAVIQPDGKIIIFGWVGMNTNTSGEFYNITRLNADGSSDISFSAGFTGEYYDSYYTNRIIKLQADGKIVLAGFFDYYYDFNSQTSTPTPARMIRLMPNGGVDPSFTPYVNSARNIPLMMEFQSSEKIVVGNYVYNSTYLTYSTIIQRLNSDGSLDSVTNAGADGNVYKTLLQPDGKILISGNLASYNGVQRRMLARINADGSLDESFDGGLHLDMPNSAFALQPDGKIITTTTTNGINAVSRLNADGSIDNSFTSGIPVVDFETLAFGIQSDGKILVSCRFSNGAALYRLNADGSLDNSFLIGSAYYDSGLWPASPGVIYDIHTQPDGKILVAGLFSSYHGIAKQSIARLNSDGSLDNSFTFPTSANNYSTIRKIALQQDGKVLIYGEILVPLGGGSSTQYTYPKRLNSDGSVDGSFTIDRDLSDGDGFSFRNAAMAIQPDGKILISATHVTNNENFVNAVFRFNTDGSIDDSFEPGRGFEGGDGAYAISIQNDGNVIIGGDFTSYDGTLKNRLVRILNTSCESTVAPLVSIIASPSATICSGGNIIFTATPVNGGSLPVYRWLRNGVEYASINGSVFNHPDLPIASGDIITCKLISNAHCVSPHNALSNGITVTFTTPVTPSVAIALTAGSNPVCTGNQLTFTATPVNGGSNPIYHWTKNGNTNIGSNSATLDYSNFISGDIIRCMITNNDGCTTQPAATSNGITINTTSPITWHLDADGDHYYTGSPVTQCSSPGTGYASTGILGLDCNDAISLITTAVTWYLDADGDGYYTGTPVVSCTSPGTGYTTTITAEGDCDNNNVLVHQEFLFYIDADQDGYGSYQNAFVCATDANTPPLGYSLSSGECNDGDPTVWAFGNIYHDADGDGYYGDVQFSCYGNSFEPGYSLTTLGADCDDNDDAIWQSVNFYIDNDDDGYTTGFAQGCFGDTFTYPPGYNTTSTLGNDCNDNDDAVWQGGPFMIDNDEDGYYGQIVFDCFGATLPPHYYYYDGNWQLDCDDNDNTILAPVLYYADTDGDHYGDANSSTYICGADHTGYVLDNSDCNDNDATIHPGAIDICNNGIDEDCNGTADDQPVTYYADADGDTYGDPLVTIQTCDANHPGYVSNNSDCDDTNADVHPGAAEIFGNGLDDNCDGLVDVVKLFRDSDNDSYGDVNVFTTDFSFPGFYNGFYYIADSTDCDDNNATVRPGYIELCDGLDNDCNGIIDDNVQQQYGYRDADGDGYADLSQNAVLLVCNGSGGYTLPPGYVYFIGIDCDDKNSTVYPGATEICDGIDNNCDGEVDEGFPTTTYYRDADGDGYGSSTFTTTAKCSVPGGYVTNSTDCNDALTAVHPGATEVCDGIDNNCDGQIDEGFPTITYYRDADGDSYGSSTVTTTAKCSVPGGYVTNSTDCNDAIFAIHPGAAEIPGNGIDENCNGMADDVSCIPTISSTTLRGCSPYPWNGTSYTSSGTYTYHTTNATGCDSAATLHLTIVTSSKPSTPASVTGPTSVCSYIGTSTATYSAPAIPVNAIKYSWTLPANVTIVSATKDSVSITVSFAPGFVFNTTKIIKVKAVGCAGSSADRSLNLSASLPSTPASINGPASVCQYIGSGTATYSAPALPVNATKYSWTLPPNITVISATTDSVSITVSFAPGFVSNTTKIIKVKAAGCSGYSADRSLTLSAPIPSTPGIITGPVDVCTLVSSAANPSGTQAVYTIRKVANATSYNWVVPTGATLDAHPGGIGTVNDTLINVTFSSSFVKDTIRVNAVSGCGISGQRKLKVSKVLPATPGTIYSNVLSTIPAITDACPTIFSGSGSLTYAIKKVANAASYDWSFTGTSAAYTNITHPNGAGINDTVITVSFDAAFTTATLNVQSVRACASSAARTLVITKKIPATPVISGNASPCPSSIWVYTATAPTGSSYIWTVPSRASIVGPSTGSSITVSFSSNFTIGNITAKAVSVCGTSTAKSFAVTKCVVAVSKSAAVSTIAESVKPDIAIYPNPTNGQFKIVVKGIKNKLITTVLVEIQNEYGQLVYSSRRENINGIIDVTMDRKVAAGMYMVHCIINGESITKKIVITK